MKLIVVGVTIVLSSNYVLESMDNGLITFAPVTQTEHITWWDVSDDDGNFIMTFTIP